MPKNSQFPDPNSVTTIGASFRATRVAPGAAGVEIVFNPNNGDAPLETTIAAALTPTGRTQLAAVIAELDAYYKTTKSYT